MDLKVDSLFLPKDNKPTFFHVIGHSFKIEITTETLPLLNCHEPSKKPQVEWLENGSGFVGELNFPSSIKKSDILEMELDNGTSKCTFFIHFINTHQSVQLLRKQQRTIDDIHH